MTKKVLCLFMLLAVLFMAMPVFAQTNAGATRLSPGGSLIVNPQICAEATANGSGFSLPCWLYSGTNQIDLTSLFLPAATASANQSGATQRFIANYWNGSASATDAWSVVNTLGSGTNPTSTLTFTHSGSTGVAALSTGVRLLLPAGTATAPSLNIPTGVAPTTSAVGDWWVPVQVVPSFSEVSGSAISVVGNIYSLAGAQAATSVNTAATITGSSFTLNAGLMNVAGKTLEGEAWLTNINVTGTPTVAIAVKIGSVTLATCTSAAITNAVTAPVHFTFTVKTAAIGASGTDESHCALDIPLAAAGNAVARVLDNNTAVSSTYDHTAANAIVLVGTSAGASNTMTLRDLRYDLKN